MGLLADVDGQYWNMHFTQIPDDKVYKALHIKRCFVGIFQTKYIFGKRNLF